MNDRVMTLTMPLSSPSTVQAPPTPLVPTPTAAASGGISFSDVLDAVNPLQHIPVVSSLYRAATGTTISDGSKVAGDTLYGALLPGGAIASLVASGADVAVKAISGKDVGQHVVDTLKDAGSAMTSTSAATPLVPSAAPTGNASTETTAAQLATSATPSLALSRHVHASGAEYRRAQALDAINRKLVKMTA